MIWVEIVCDGCNDNPLGEFYRKGSIQRIKANAKSDGWKFIKGGMYCPKCQEKMKRQKGEVQTE